MSMVKNAEGLAKYLSDWIATQARAAKAGSLVVGVSGGVDSAVVYALCRRTSLSVHGVVMPCGSSPSAMTRAQEVLEAFGGTKYHVALDNAFASIAAQAGTATTEEERKAAEGALRSCLRAPTLDYIGKLNNGIIVGTGNRDEDQVTRYYQKRGDGAVDISPIATLHKSEVYDLARYLGVPQSVIDATPSADLWGPDAGQEDEKQLEMTYQEIEQATRLVGHLYNMTQAQAFNHYAAALETSKTGDARFIAVLRKLAHLEMSSRHKENPNLPVCNAREPGLGYLS